MSANGVRFHLAEAGSGPLVLLLHGFPEFWWSWRHQLPALAAGGYRVVAPDLRGYGGSDKPPRGYDLFSLAADIAGIVRALGERSAVLVGHDVGGALAWSAAALHPSAVRGLAALASPHPLSLRAGMVRDPRGQLRAAGFLFRFQVPVHPEGWLTRDDAAEVGRLLHAWSGPGWPDEESERRYREAIRITGVAHSALEYHRWAGRSQLRPDGRRYARAMARPIEAPTLVVHGTADPCALLPTAHRSGRHVVGAYEWHALDAVGHFPQEEEPVLVTELLLRWLDEVHGR